MDPIQITCKLADKLGQNRFWENRISKGVYESGEYSDEEYAKLAHPFRTVMMEDGYNSSFSVSVLEIVQMVLEIQQEEHNRWESSDGFSTPEEYAERVKKLYE